MTPLQLNAITTRLKLPEPTCESGDARKDLGHVLDFVTQLKYLKVLFVCVLIQNRNEKKRSADIPLLLLKKKTHWNDLLNLADTRM